MSILARTIRKLGIARAPIPGRLRLPKDCSSKIYLTFDDGPDGYLTPRILNLLARHNIKASFFVAGCRVQHCPELARRIVAEGHLLANHAYTLAPLYHLPVDKGFQEVERCHAIIQPIGGQRIFRPPNGLIRHRLYYRLVQAGYRIDYWSMDSGDSENTDGAVLGERLVNCQPLGHVILFHDDRRNGVDALEIFLTKTRARGYQFGSVAETVAVPVSAPVGP